MSRLFRSFPFNPSTWTSAPGTMGSVGSVINGGLDTKHCAAALPYRPRKARNQQRKSVGRSLDGLLNCGFAQGPASSAYAPKGLAHSRSGRSEDFFYIKVSHKPRSAHHRGGGESMEDQGNRDGESNGRLQAKLTSGKITEISAAEEPSVHSTNFKPVLPPSASSPSTTETGRYSLDRILGPLEKTRCPDNRFNKRDTSGTFSDSGRNSMSSLPTHSNSGSLSASTGPVSHRHGGSAPCDSLSNAAKATLPLWVKVNSANLDCSHSTVMNNGDPGPPLTADEPDALTRTAGGIRAPISTNESLIERLEQRLLERETELQELQVSFEENEVDACQLFQERQTYCAEEMEGLRQRCSTKLRQASQMAAKAHQALQLQVRQLQEEKVRLQDDVSELRREKELVELRLRSYQSQSLHLAPTLEETQWEVCQKSGEISLLKQQLRDSQADVTHKLSEIVALRASLKDNAAKTEALERQNKDCEEQGRSRTIEVEVCQNELQRKKNEADFLREKVGKLERDIQEMKQDLAAAKEERSQLPRKGQADAPNPALERSEPPTLGQEEEEERTEVSTKSLQREVERLQQQLRQEQDDQHKLAVSFQKERQTWNREKERVIKYQKQLQNNYLQMHRKNRDLERILKEVTVELESRTELGLELPYGPGLKTYDDIIATEI